MGRCICAHAIPYYFFIASFTQNRKKKTFQIPFRDFVLTNTGEIVHEEVTMDREKVRTVGISLLGGNSGIEGPYELGIDSIRAVNEEDTVVVTGLFLPFFFFFQFELTQHVFDLTLIHPFFFSLLENRKHIIPRRQKVGMRSLVKQKYAKIAI
jgi:Complex I intermediate-associated protein 30 (CIA30)